MTKTIHRLIGNLKNSLRGFSQAWAEYSFRVEIICGFFIFAGIFFSHQTSLIKTALVICYCLLLAFELMNTAIEGTCNRITRDFDEQIRNVKDISSAAVFVVAMINVILFLMLFV